jgi:hypothetical protein
LFLLFNKVIFGSPQKKRTVPNWTICMFVYVNCFFRFFLVRSFLSPFRIFLFHLFMYTTYADVRCCLTSTYPNNSVIDLLTLTFLTECPFKMFNFRVSFLVFLFFALSNFHTIFLNTNSQAWDGFSESLSIWTISNQIQ